MSDILIKGMEMPKGCNECRFHDGSWCCAQPIKNWRDSYYRPPEGEKQPTCPLVEVPPHGDLIERSSVYKVLDDRIAFYKEAGDDYNACNIACIEADIVVLPTIIEAST